VLRRSPRNFAGAIKTDMRFSGAPDPEGSGYVPNITQDETGIGYWSQREIADYLATGLTPVTQAGKSMTPVITNLAHLSADDRAGMAEYIKTLSAIDAPNAGAPPLNRTAVIRMLPTTAGAVKSPTSGLAAPDDAVAPAATLYTVVTKPLFVDRSGANPTGAGDGSLLPAAKLTVVARDGDWLQVRVDGWQQDGSPAAFYALKGQRILVAMLGPPAVAKVTRQQGLEDAATKLMWFPGSITVWITKESLNPDIDKIWDYSSNLYVRSCGACHAPPPADSQPANRWIGSMSSMKRFTSLDDAQYRLLQAYVQFHSKDVTASTAGGKP